MYLWLRWINILYLICLYNTFASADDIHPTLFKKATLAYKEEKYFLAVKSISDLPNLLGLVPLLDQPTATERAKIFFDLGRIFFASGDTVRATVLLKYVLMLDPKISSGILPLKKDWALEWSLSYLKQLKLQKREEKFALTSPFQAAGRSLLLPGWGQIYQGHLKRGVVLMSTAAAFTTAWLISYQSYRKAYDIYQSTTPRDLRLPERRGFGEDPFPFEIRYKQAKSRAKIANIALGMLATVWIGNVIDNLYISPGRLTVALQIK